MRISQIKSLNEIELGLLLYVLKEKSPIDVTFDINPHTLRFVKLDAALWKLSKESENLTDDGKIVFESLMSKLNKTWMQEVSEFEAESKKLSDMQLLFQF